MQLINLNDKLERQIPSWPVYRPPFVELDYALRAGGWLDTIGQHTGCLKFGFIEDSQLVGFSLLDRKSSEDAELFIAIHGEWVNSGIGKKACLKTIEHGFETVRLQRIHLKVRTNHHVGIRLYGKLGFKNIGEVWETVNNINTHFYLMEIHKNGVAFHNTSIDLA